MKKINISKWKPFLITDIFEVENTKCTIGASVIPNSGNIPYITASSFNNGVSDYINYDESQIDEGNTIFIGGKTRTISYQPNDFISNDSHNLTLRLKEKTEADKYCQLFMVAVLKKTLNYYKWLDSISKTSIKKNQDIIYLPTKNDGSIDYEYMRKFVKEIEIKEKAHLEILKILL